MEAARSRLLAATVLLFAILALAASPTHQASSVVPGSQLLQLLARHSQFPQDSNTLWTSESSPATCFNDRNDHRNRELQAVRNSLHLPCFYLLSVTQKLLLCFYKPSGGSDTRMLGIKD